MIDTRVGSSAARSDTMLQPVLLTPLRSETMAARLGTRGRRSPSSPRIERIGMGAARAEVARARLSRSLAPGTPIAVIGLAGGLSERDRAGDVVVATEFRLADGTQPAAEVDPALAERIRLELTRTVGQRVRSGPVVCTPTLLPAAAVAALPNPAAAGALACEMESLWLAPLAARHPFAVVRVIIDRPGRGLAGPWTLPAGVTALRRLAAISPVVACILAGSTPPDPTS